MKLRLVDILLLAVIAVGCVFVWKTGQERSRLTARYARLAAVTGDLKITDPAKVHFQALETGDPMHFAWRIYTPPKYKTEIHRTGGGGWASSSEAKEFIGRVRLRADDRGDLEVYTRFAGGSSQGGIVSGALAKSLKNHWKELQIEQIGANGLTVFGPDKTVTLLRITLPEDFQTKTAESLGHPVSKRFVPEFFELKLGPDAAKP